MSARFRPIKIFCTESFSCSGGVSAPLGGYRSSPVPHWQASLRFDDCWKPANVSSVARNTGSLRSDLVDHPVKLLGHTVSSCGFGRGRLGRSAWSRPVLDRAKLSGRFTEAPLIDLTGSRQTGKLEGLPRIEDGSPGDGVRPLLENSTAC